MAREKNPFGKTVDVDAPYATFKAGDFEIRILKTYQTPANEEKNGYGRWFVAAKSPFTFGSWEMGDSYIAGITTGHTLTQATDAWLAAYPGMKVVRRTIGLTSSRERRSLGYRSNLRRGEDQRTIPRPKPLHL